MASDLYALPAQLVDDDFDALLLDGAHARGRHTQAHPALLALEPETLRVQVRQEAAALLVVGVGDAVSDSRLLAGDFADAGHGIDLRRINGLGAYRRDTGRAERGFIPAWPVARNRWTRLQSRPRAAKDTHPSCPTTTWSTSRTSTR